jgi:hypothetical protein
MLGEAGGVKRDPPSPSYGAASPSSLRFRLCCASTQRVRLHRISVLQVAGTWTGFITAVVTNLTPLDTFRHLLTLIWVPICWGLASDFWPLVAPASVFILTTIHKSLLNLRKFLSGQSYKLFNASLFSILHPLPYIFFGSPRCVHLRLNILVARAHRLWDLKNSKIVLFCFPETKFFPPLCHNWCRYEQIW